MAAEQCILYLSGKFAKDKQPITVSGLPMVGVPQVQITKGRSITVSGLPMVRVPQFLRTKRRSPTLLAFNKEECEKIIKPASSEFSAPTLASSLRDKSGNKCSTSELQKYFTIIRLFQTNGWVVPESADPNDDIIKIPCSSPLFLELLRLFHCFCSNFRHSMERLKYPPRLLSHLSRNFFMDFKDIDYNVCAEFFLQCIDVANQALVVEIIGNHMESVRLESNLFPASSPAVFHDNSDKLRIDFSLETESPTISCPLKDDRSYNLQIGEDHYESIRVQQSNLFSLFVLKPSPSSVDLICSSQPYRQRNIDLVEFTTLNKICQTDSFQRGNYGNVAVYRYAGKSVVLKTTNNATATDNEKIKNEREILKSIFHPYIVQCYGFTKLPANPENASKSKETIILEYHSRRLTETLSDPVFNFELVEFFYKLSCAICFLHSRGIYHNDIKADNILIDSLGNPVLCDFGEATEYDDASFHAQKDINDFLVLVTLKKPTGERLLPSLSFEINLLITEFVALSNKITSMSVIRSFFLSLKDRGIRFFNYCTEIL